MKYDYIVVGAGFHRPTRPVWRLRKCLIVLPLARLTAYHE